MEIFSDGAPDYVLEWWAFDVDAIMSYKKKKDWVFLDWNE